MTFIPKTSSWTASNYSLLIDLIRLMITLTPTPLSLPYLSLSLLTSVYHIHISFLQLPELFVSFEEKPQGAASLAQVHKAVLHDGRTVAVKVQHPKVQRQSSKDIMVMEVSLFGKQF